MLLEFRMLPNRNLVANTDEAKAKLKRVKSGEPIIIDFKPKRNARFHRKLFALLKVIFQNQEHYESIDHLREMVTIKAGHCETILAPNGYTHFKAKSISFSEMDEAEFEDFYSKILDIAFEWFGMDRDLVEQELVRFM